VQPALRPPPNLRAYRLFGITASLGKWHFGDYHPPHEKRRPLGVADRGCIAASRHHRPESRLSGVEITSGKGPIPERRP
jgi:hypothetical protein